MCKYVVRHLSSWRKFLMLITKVRDSFFVLSFDAAAAVRLALLSRRSIWLGGNLNATMGN